VKIEVHLLGGTRKVIDITPGATVGATIGKDVFNADGTLFSPSTGGSSGGQVGISDWTLLLNIPPNVQALGNFGDTGLYVITGTGTSVSREITGAAGQITVQFGDGVTADPLLGLADVADAGGGVLQRTAFDAKGRKTGSSAATTDDLTEGASNLYFTQARVRSTVLTGLSVATGGAIVATDSVLAAFGKLQNQVSLRLTDAPSDSSTYGRRNGAWVTTIGEAPIDGSTYGRKDGAWVVVTGGGGGGGTVTSVSGSGGTTGLTLTGGPITGSGTLTLGGTLAIASGGTGATTAAAARTALGATTVGGNLFTLSNPSAVTFLRVNADNSVSALDASTFRSAIGAGTGGGSVTSVAVSGGTTGLTTSGGPITSSGTITISGTLAVANGGTGATTAAGAPWVLRSGDTMSGGLTAPTLTATGTITSGTSFQSSTSNVVLAPGSAGGVILRPNGMGYSAGQAALDTSGSFSTFQLIATGGVVAGGATFLILGPTAASTVRLRPSGTGSTTGEVTVDPTIVSFSQALTVGSTITANTTFASSTANVVLAPASTGSVIFRPNGAGSTSGQAFISSSGDLTVSGNVSANGASLTAAGHEFYRAAANSTTLTRQPRIWVGGSDPGAAAADGDIWIP